MKEDIVFELNYTSERDFDFESSTGILTIIKRYWWAIDPRLYKKQSTSNISTDRKKIHCKTGLSRTHIFVEGLSAATFK